MITDYKLIQGWFDFENVYDEELQKLSAKFKRKLVIVEIGAWLGKSSFYLVERHSNKGDIYIVDTWQGADDSLETAHKLATLTDIFILFMKNMKVHLGKFIPFRALSCDSAAFFEDNSVDFIFIDGDHTYEGVKEDIASWLPKLSKGGTIGGHDYTSLHSEVIRAVNEAFGEENIKINGASWIFEDNR